MSPSIEDLTGNSPKKGTEFVFSQKGARIINKRFPLMSKFKTGDKLLYPEFRDTDNLPNTLFMTTDSKGIHVSLSEDLFSKAIVPTKERK